MSRIKTLYKLYFDALNLLDDKSKNRYIWLLLTQIFVSLLDILAISVIGYLGVFATSSEKNLPEVLTRFLNFLDLGNISENTIFIIIALIGTSILVLRSIISSILSLRILKFLSSQSGKLTQRMVADYFSGSIDKIRKFKQQEFIYISTAATDDWALRVLGGFSFLISETFLLVSVSITLFLIRPLVFLIAALYFLIVVFLFYRTSLKPRQNLGRIVINESIKIQEQMELLYNHFKELSIYRAADYFLNESTRSRKKRQSALAQLSYLPGLSKYVLEVGIVIGALILGGLQLLFMSPERAVGNFAIFFLAASRVAPALMRIQQYAFGIGSVKNSVENIANFLRSSGESSLAETKPMYGELPNNCLISIDNIEYKFEDAEGYLLDGISFKIESGQKIALIGETGSGKSTLLDCILGFKSIKGGAITINRELFSDKDLHPPILFIPQSIGIINATLRENLILNQPSAINRDEIIEAIELFGLAESLGVEAGKSLDIVVGQTGLKLSGGQVQRVGLIRAYLRKPKLLILDEPTSALDGISEKQMLAALNSNTWNMATLVVAHRLSTIVNSDLIMILSKGRISEFGTYEELAARSKIFQQQLDALGIGI